VGMSSPTGVSLRALVLLSRSIASGNADGDMKGRCDHTRMREAGGQHYMYVKFSKAEEDT
jgi:hypothetical protein